MIYIIKLEFKDPNYLIRFNGKKHQFNEYINKVMLLPDKEFDKENKCWSIPSSSFDFFKRCFKDQYDLEGSDVKEFKKEISSYSSMGKDMKLSPYDYQKEAIKFGLDNNNVLIVYPCGSGKKCA